MVLFVFAPSASADWHGSPYDLSGQPRSEVVRIMLAGRTASQLQALALNRSVPAEPARIVPAAPIMLLSSSTSGPSGLSAIDCLTAAVYYEAANEPMAGQRAVAQVILNRSRHPTFPNSVCGVVFQGAERASGCQFTFTCDGSLRRRPSSSGWQKAQVVAIAALAGYVERSVGHATHYHADYVRPYWAPSLVKLNHLGSHIFYVWPGRAGNAAAFNQALSASEALPPRVALALSDYLMTDVYPAASEPVALAASSARAFPALNAAESTTQANGPALTPSLGAANDATGLIERRAQLALPETRLREAHHAPAGAAGADRLLRDH